MKSFKIKIADKVFELFVNFGRTCRICHDFLVDDAPDVYIHCSYEEYDLEKALYEVEYNKEAPGDIQLELFSLLHQVADELVNYDTILVHGAAISYKGEAYVFSAPSGTGKTTHIYKWLNKLPNAFVVNGDKPFVKFTDIDSKPIVYGSPWAGKENLYTNTMVPLKAIICMERADCNNIYEIGFEEAFLFILQQTHRPNDEEKMRKTLHLLQRLNGKAKFYLFQCNNFKDDCFDVAYNALVKEQV